MRYRIGRAGRFAFETLEPRMLLAADLWISEFLARNDDSILDEDGDDSDWIEIYNAGNEAADLAGWYLTDNPTLPAKWTFPAVSLPANGRLVVFASNKDRRDPAGELHTNFVLDGGGEYLALYEPDGVTVKHEFAPEYPNQREDISFGLEEEIVTTALVETSSGVKYLVPAQAADLPADWFQPASDDTAWNPGTFAVGYDVENGPGGGVFNVNFAPEGIATQSSTFSGNTADRAIDGNFGNFTHTAYGVNLPAWWQIDLGQSRPIDEIVLYNRTSCCASRLRDVTVEIFADDGTTVAFASDLLNPENVLGGGLLNQGPDSLTIDLIAEAGGPMDGRFVRVTRTPDPDNSGVGGDPAAGPSEADVLSLGEVEVSGMITILPDFETDLQSAMLGQNASVFLRSAFDVADPAALDRLSLDVTYDDGFIAYLNGTRIASRRAPDVPAFDSTAEILTAPDEIADLALWLRDPANTFNVDTGVWSDVSGNGRDASAVGTVATANGPIDYLAPTLAAAGANASVFANGFSTVRFAGLADDMLAATGLNAGVGLNSLTVLAVYKTSGTDATSPYTRPVGFGSYAANGGAGGDHFNLAADPSIRKDNGSIGGYSSTHPANTFFIRAARMDAGGVDEWFNVDGTLSAVLTNAGAQYTTSNDAFYLGDVRGGLTPPRGAGNSRADVEIAEVVVFNTALSDAEIGQVNDWLEANVGLMYGELEPITETIDVSPHLGLLQPTGNVLAIQGLNDAVDGGDFLIAPTLTAQDVVAVNERYFDVPTPGEPNGAGYIGFVADTAFSVDRGFYDEPIDVAITSATPGAVIRYTADGSKPTATHGTVYDGPVYVDGQATLRAAAFLDGYLPTNVDTHTYVFLDDVITQPAAPAGFPTTWGGTATNYEMDPNVVGQNGTDAFSGLYADTIKDDLRSIPTLSIVMDVDDLFGAGGIYANPTQRGKSWEREASIEYILPDGSTGFQEDAGVRIFGFSSRNPSTTPKHSLRLLFKDKYGDEKLAYPLFADSEAGRFDDIVLRATNAKSWTDNRSSGDLNWNTQAQFIRDTWARDTLRDMGQPTSHATYVHLYLNGLYWGLYNPVERLDAGYMAEYFGGDEEDYDVLNTRTGTIEVVDGNRDAWDELMTVVSGDVSTLDGWNDVLERVDVDDVIDWFNLYFYAGARDWVGTNGNNMRVARLREPGAGWIAVPWDFENTVWYATDNNLNVRADLPTLGKVHTKLLSNPEYVLRFADRVRKHFFHGGALTSEEAAGRWMVRATEIDRAVVGESARWGDTRVEPPRTRDVEWLAEQNRLLTEYFPQRTNILLDQYRAAGLYPMADAPEFQVDGVEQYGGNVTPDNVLAVTAPAGDVYFTADGTDPRQPGGGIHPEATLYTAGFSLQRSTLLKARVLSGGQWSALSEAAFVVESPLRVSEIMFNPADPTLGEITAGFTNNDDFEFIELVNPSQSAAIALDGAAFTQGIRFTFPDTDPNVDETVLGPGERILVVRDLAAFAERYGTAGMNVAGEYRNPVDGSNRLDNNGETLTLSDSVGVVIQSFRYDDRRSDGWPGAADGNGSSLEMIDPDADFSLAANWYASPQMGGSPGVAAASAVLDRLVFYNGSAHDGGDGGANEADDGAVATDKSALLPGQAASLANVTSFASGINGIMIDLAGASDTLSPADFQFRVGNDDDPSQWDTPADPGIDVRRIDGITGRNRVSLTWPDSAIRNQWLQVTVLPTTETGLMAADVFYFGNAVGETGNSTFGAGLPTPPPLVNAADVIAIRDNPRGVLDPAAIDNPFDVDRDRQVNAVDLILARDNATSPLSALRWIVPADPVARPAPPVAPEGRLPPAIGLTLGNKAYYGPLAAAKLRSGHDCDTTASRLSTATRWWERIER